MQLARCCQPAGSCKRQAPASNSTDVQPLYGSSNCSAYRCKLWRIMCAKSSSTAPKTQCSKTTAKSYAKVWCMPLLSCPCMILHMLYPSDTHSSAIACSYHKHQSETPPHPKNQQTTAFLRLNLQPPGAAAATAAAAAVLRIVTNYCTKEVTA